MTTNGKKRTRERCPDLVEQDNKSMAIRQRRRQHPMANTAADTAGWFLKTQKIMTSIITKCTTRSRLNEAPTS